MTTGADVVLRPLRPEDGAIVATLFGANGACGGCWCMHWRVPHGGRHWQAVKGAPNRARFLALVAAGRVRAVLAFAGDVPVGWCCIGPVEDFPRLEGARSLRRERPPGTWAVVCFFIKAGWRRRGIAGRLLAAAVDHAFAAGAAEIEGWPAVPRTDPMPGAFAWTGVPALFAAAGFSPLPRAPRARPIYVRRRPP
ncbi:MAG: GNAT family N-acetyltransferase [Alphaproteobacteria bacterium]|nr:GNAT family N-acetyltransferase [Alphaproteobacteria bacterium]